MAGIFFALVALALVLSALLWYFKQQQADTPPPSPPAPVAKRTDLDMMASYPGQDDNWLVGTAGDVSGKVFKIGNRTVTIGRDVGNFIQIDDSEVSRRHCQISPVPEGLRVVDMKSRNGTLVNGRPITDAVVPDNGEIQIGDARLMYCREADFDVDDSLAPKKAGVKAKMFTQSAGGANFKKQLHDALRAANGDYDKAAEYLSIDPKLFRKVIESHKDRTE